MRGGWARHALERYGLLKRWMEHVGFIVEACEELLGDAHVYVVGGAAEDRLTVLSDIDVIVTVKDLRLKNLDTVLAIKRRARELGLRDDVPIDLKVMGEGEFSDLLSRGIYKKAIKVK